MDSSARLAFWQAAFIAISVRLVDPELIGMVDLAHEPAYRAQLDAAVTIADEMRDRAQNFDEVNSFEG